MMRPLLAAVMAAATLAAAPGAALAQSRSADEMRDPLNQAAMAGAVRAMSEVLLAIKVAPILKAVEAVEGGDARDVDPDLTLRDIAGPEADRVPREMSRRVPAMMGAMGEMAGAFEEMLPALRGMADVMRERVEDAARR